MSFECNDSFSQTAKCNVENRSMSHSVHLAKYSKTRVTQADVGTEQHIVIELCMRNERNALPLLSPHIL